MAAVAKTTRAFLIGFSFRGFPNHPISTDLVCDLKQGILLIDNSQLLKRFQEILAGWQSWSGLRK
jgi:hypothetical protein